MQGTECAKVERDSQVKGQMDLIEKCLCETTGTLERLEARLQPVLRSEPKTEGDCADRAQLVELAEGLYNFAHRISVIEKRMQRILECLEL
jgi:hypothetical protein